VVRRLYRRSSVASPCDALRMPERSRKRPRDANELGAWIVDRATSEEPAPDPDEGKDPLTSWSDFLSRPRTCRPGAGRIARRVSGPQIQSDPPPGRELYISDTTVKTHITHILRKLDLRDRVQAVVLAHETGLFDEPRT
jgi:hypothetical protein